ncbi:MAG: translocation/assembly module TamB domain-containing protein [Roseiarcus sp.]
MTFLGIQRVTLALIAALFVIHAPARADEADKGVLANLISQALSSPTTSVSIGAVDGVLSSDATISNIVLSDRDGPWMKIDKARLVWRRLALLSRRLEVDQLTIGHMQFLRRPLPSQAPPPPDAGGIRSILPELPVRVVIKQFAIEELSLGEPLIGVAARLNIAGKATLGPPSEGLDLTLTARRLYAAGEFRALMTYVPATDKLTLSINSEEPAGGLFVHLVNLPGLPPARLAFNGAGALDNFTAKLDFSAGPDVWANGEVVVARKDAGRRLTLDLNSRLEGMTPPIIRPIFAGETTLKGDLLFNDDSTIVTPGLHLVSGNARLDIEGGKSVNDTLDIKIHAGATPGATQIGKLDLNASIVGPIASPTIEGAFDVADIHVAEGSLEHAAATFHAAPNGSLADEATRIAFQGQAVMSGLALADPALAQAVGSEAKLTLSGSASPGGDIAFDALELAASDLDARYSGLLAPKVVRGRLEVAARDLSRFALLAGTALKGEARLTAELDGAPRYGELNATVDARATKLVTGYPLLDKITGGDLKVTGAARTMTGGGFGFTDLVAEGARGSARLNGSYATDKVDLDARIDVPEVQAVDPRVVGRAAVVAALTGTPDDLGANLKATLSEGRLLDRKTSGLTLEAEASHLTKLLEAKASLSGDVDGHQLQGSAHVAARADGGWAIDSLVLSLASARLDGAVTIGADRLTDGKLNFSATNLDDLSPLVLTKLSGAVQAKVEAASASGKQALSVAATSDGMSLGGARIEGLKVDMAVDDLWAARGVSGQARLARAEFGGQSLADVRLTATARGESSDLDFTGSVRGLAVKARAQLSGGQPIRLDLASLTADGAGRRLALAAPATLTYGDGALDIRNFALRVDSGRLSVSGRAGLTLDLRATAAGLPLAALDIFSPGLGLAGVADGDATIGGTPANPTGDWRLRLKQVSATQTRSVGAPLLDVAGSGRLAGGRTSLDLRVNAGAGNAIRLTGSAPLSPDGALDVKIDGRLDAGLANAALSVAGRHVSGSLTVAMQLAGTVAKPQARGSIRLTGGAFSDDQTGFKLTAIGGVIQANGDAIRIDRLTGTTPDAGSIEIGGEVRLDPAGGFPGALKVTGRRAQLVANDIVTATADLALDITGRLSQTPAISGRITVVSMDITVPERLDSVSAPIPGTRHINPTATARALLAVRAREQAAHARAPLFNATLALTISAANRVFLHGHGIDAEAAGDLHVAGSARDPQVTGGFDLLRGSLSLVGKRLVFTRGRVRFHGDVTPELDLVAETSSGGVTARISVTGPASQPSFAITSTPSLPEDEILSRVLFQQSSGSLSPFQALELANSAAMLSGRGDAFETLRRSLGVNSLNITSSATSNGDPLLGLGRAINDRISVGVTTGARTRDNGVSLDLDVTRHIRLQAGVDASGGSSAGVGAEWEYK